MKDFDRLFNSEKIMKLQVEENFNFFEINIVAQTCDLPTYDELYEFIKNIPGRDIFNITINTDYSEQAQLTTSSGIDAFLNKINDLIEQKDEDENFYVKLCITKTIADNKISIYSFDDCTKFLKDLELREILSIFNNYIINNNYVIFECIRNDIKEFYSKTIYFLNKNSQVTPNLICNKTQILEKRNEVCTFLNAGEFYFIPDDFKLVCRSNNENINYIFDKLLLLITLCFIANISALRQDKNEMIYKIHGYKLIDEVVSYNNLPTMHADEFYRIYNWAYDRGSISDRIGIARNVLSIDINNRSLINISNGILDSIKSAHEIYLKENVQQYVEVKNKISEFLFDMTQRTSEIANSLVKSYINNLIAIITYFATITIAKAFDQQKFENIFTKDITFISITLIALSVVYMIYSRKEAISEQERFKTQYERIRYSYDEILNLEDLKNIFKNDRYYQEDINYINEKIKRYTKVWIITIIIISLLVIILGFGHGIKGLII